MDGRDLVNIHHLELFYYVARHGGIMEAVRNIPYGIQQPAVSGQILQLENDLGIKLFHRRPFQLTAPGQQLYEFIQPFFAQVEEVGERLRGGLTQTIRMAAPQVALREHLPELLGEVRKQFPKLRLTLREAHQPQIEVWLERHEIDFAITILEGRTAPGLNLQALLELPVSFLVPTRSRWTTSDLVLEALAAGAELPPLITLPPNETVPRVFRELLASRGLEWGPSIEASALELIEVYVASGFGMGLTLQVPREKPSTKVRLIPIRGLAPVRIGALWRGQLPPVTQSLLETLKSRAARLTAQLAA